MLMQLLYNQGNSNIKKREGELFRVKCVYLICKKISLLVRNCQILDCARSTLKAVGMYLPVIELFVLTGKILTGAVFVTWMR